MFEAETVEVDTSRPAASVPASRAEAAAAAAPEEARPTRIGPYRVLNELGRGGMGIVYLAVGEEDLIKRHVAIKLLKRGMDTEDLLRRFGLERQLLSALNHPGIARLYDAGETEDGRPYFVMEHVEGLPIDEYCDVHRLEIEHRLELFERVCSAVHHAHQHLIVHRDIKPSNIIVTADGQPKLLDFGIAKVINPEYELIAGDPTRATMRLMTPEYASPEQVRGMPVSTASDVYSLGVLLYELLSGHRPYQLRQRIQSELERVVCEVDPERPSTAVSRSEEVTEYGATTRTVTPETVSRTRGGRPERLRRRLSGDLDNIVLMAMRKEPQRRYRSAEQLAEDIERHRRGHPVIARADTVGYRVAKFVRRNRAPVAASVLFVIVLAAGLVGTASGWRAARVQRDEALTQRAEAERQRNEAETQRDRANRRFDEVRGLARTFMFDFHDAIQSLDGAMPARELLVTTALRYLDGLAKEAADDPALQAELAAAYERVGDIQGGIRNPSLGGVGKAAESYRAAFEIRQRLAAAQPDDAARTRELALSRIRLGDVLQQTDDVAGALVHYRAALADLEQVAAQAPADASARENVAVAQLALGGALVASGDADEALSHYERSLAIRRELAAERPGDADLQRAVSVACLRVGGRLADLGRHADALSKYEEAARIRARLSASDPANGRWRRDLGVAQYFVGNELLALGRTDEALESFRSYLAIARQRAEDNPTSARAKRDLAVAHDGVGRLLATQAAWAAALEQFRSAAAIAEALAAAEPTDLEYRVLAGTARAGAAEARAALGETVGALDDSRQAVNLLEAVLKSSDDVRRRAPAAEAHLGLGRLLAADGRRGEALSHLERARDLFASATEADPDDQGARIGLASALQELSGFMRAIDDRPAALGYAERALEAAPTATPELLRELAAALHSAGNAEAAVRRATEALSLLEARSAPGDAELRTALEAELRTYRGG